MIATVLLVLLLVVMIVMAIRDGRPFFADLWKVSALIIVVVLALLTWLPLARVR